MDANIVQGCQTSVSADAATYVYVFMGVCACAFASVRVWWVFVRCSCSSLSAYQNMTIIHVDYQLLNSTVISTQPTNTTVERML